MIFDEIEKRKFHSFKSAIVIDDVNIDKIVIYEKFLCSKKGSKYSVCYKNNYDVTSLCVLLSKKWMALLKNLIALRACLFCSKMKNYWQNTMKYGVILKNYRKKKIRQW